MSAFGGMLPREIFPDAVDRIVEPSGRCMSMGLWCRYLVVRSGRCDSGRYIPVAPVSDM